MGARDILTFQNCKTDILHVLDVQNLRNSDVINKIINKNKQTTTLSPSLAKNQHSKKAFKKMRPGQLHITVIKETMGVMKRTICLPSSTPPPSPPISQPLIAHHESTVVSTNLRQMEEKRSNKQQHQDNN